MPKVRSLTTESAWRRDVLALCALCGLILVVVVSRARLDNWLARIDILQQQFPNYWFLGTELRAGNIPGWNPHQMSGMPFAGDPLSGWMLAPVMVLFTLFPSIATFKLLLAFNLLLAGIGAYVLARLLSMSWFGALVAGIGYGSGGLVHFNTYCCNIMGNYAPWIPVVLIGLELALRAASWQTRIAALGLAGFGVSQLLAAWIGQGTYYAVLLTGGFLVYRGLISPYDPRTSARVRLVTTVVTTIGALLVSLGLSAAGLLPRLDVNRVSNLSGGDYGALDLSSDRGWTIRRMLWEFLSPEFDARRTYLGTALVVFGLLGVVAAWRRYSAPYFAVMSATGMLLTLRETPLHHVIYLLPRFEELHTHSDYRITGAFLLGPAMLAGAGAEMIAHHRVRVPGIGLGALPGLAVLVAGFLAGDTPDRLGTEFWIVAVALTIAIPALLWMRWVVAQPSNSTSQRWAERVLPLALALMPLVVFMDPAGTDAWEASTAAYGGDFNRGYWRPIRADRIVEVHTRCEDPHGAGGFLASTGDGGQPARYFGYDPKHLRHAGPGGEGESYHGMQAEPQIQAVLTGMRATCLGLEDIQGYNPVQLQRYVEFLAAANGVPLDYHDAVVLTSGIDSPLIDVLAARYLVIPAHIPFNRPDLLRAAASGREVFKNDRVRVIERRSALPRAWIAHDVRSMPRERVLPVLSSGMIDPGRTAIVESEPPPFAPGDPAMETVTFTRESADAITIHATASAPGLLVVSEMFAPGWRAYVDGVRTPTMVTDYVLRGVPIEAGTHRVEMRYEPRSLEAGLWITGLTGAVVIAAAASLLLPKSRRRDPVRE